jgi:simple sugar transport system permease protein
MLAVGSAGGGVWALGPALAKARLRISEIVTGLLFTLAAVLLVGALSRGRWRDPLALGFPLSKSLPESASLPSIPGTSIHLGLVLALGAALVVWLLLTQTAFGRDTSPSTGKRGVSEPGNRTVGEVLLVTLAAGALAGGAGMIELVAVAHRLHPDLSPGYGYIGILVAALARFAPAGVVLVAVPAAALLTAGHALQGLGVDVLVVRIAQVAIALVAVGAVVLSRSRVEWEPSWPERASPEAR